MPDAPRPRALRPATGTVITEIVRLYREGLSTRRIGDAIGMDRQAVTRVLRIAGVPIAPRGAGRARPTTRLAAQPGVDERIREMYLEQCLTRTEIAAALGLRESEVRSRMTALGIHTRSRGRHNREDRRRLDPEQLEDLYLANDLTADQVGDVLGTSRHAVLRAAHELGLPVRLGGDHPPRRGPTEIELIQALYDDPLVADAVARHGLPVCPAASPIQRRFPEPIPLTRTMLIDLYDTCGLSTTHIELLTGQPAATVRHQLRRWNVPLRDPGGRSPFRIRWRHDQVALRKRVRRTRPGTSGVDHRELDDAGVNDVVSSDSTIQPAT